MEHNGLEVTFDDIPALGGTAPSVVAVSMEDMQLAVSKHEGMFPHYLPPMKELLQHLTTGFAYSAQILLL